jgi:hypothetical protein
MTAMSHVFKMKSLKLRNPFKGDDNGVYYVIHPLDDVPEEKRDPSTLGPMRLSKGGKLSLYALQGYLVLMLSLAVYRVLEMAGLLGHLVH